ncbi:MAG: sigma-70 family RNA polymerase sigma factor [Ignavibacteria bacterium]|nr:sigma-70 family RNA polymerase sigma factor [Ignavibacteria bacterium]MBI3766713.1 sigma-70 family RNA polymerase sigma factor [Ignavibacteriales bacterium]
MPLSDSEIINRIRSGAKRDFALLVNRYKDKGMTLAMRMLRSREDAEEATQDAFIRAYNALDKFEGAARFGTWFYRILYNVCLTKLGQRKEAFQSINYDDGKENDAVETASMSSLEDELAMKDMVTFVRSIISGLPEKYATILSLFYQQELSHEEICKVTDLPLGTVKVHLFRARTLLQERLRNELRMENSIV